MTYLYIIQSLSSPKRRYIGVAADLSQRLNDHNIGRCLYTSKFKPWKIVYTEKFDNKLEALMRELQIKKWTRAKKSALVSGNQAELRKLSKSRR